MDADAGGEVLDLDVSGVAQGGWCVARDADGRVVFVRHALPGERVRARVTEATASFARADAVAVLRASPDRVEPRCPHARPGGCGGCDWQHADLAAQRRLKAEVVREQLRRIAGLDREVTVEPVAGDDGGLGWRTRVRFSVGPDGTAGLLAHRSHDVVDVGDCPIAHPLVRTPAVTGRNWAPARSVEVAVSPAAGERALIVVPGTGQSAANAGLAGAADTVLAAGRGGKLATLSGRGSLRQQAAGRWWRVSAGAFWQVHPGAAGRRRPWPSSTRPGPGGPAGSSSSCWHPATGRARCAGWPTYPATRPPWPVTSPCAPGSAGGWTGSGRSTRSR